MSDAIAEQAAFTMLRTMVEDLRLKPDSTVNGAVFEKTFRDPPWRPSDFDLGRRYLQRQGWIETQGSMLKLTGLGYAEAFQGVAQPGEAA